MVHYGLPPSKDKARAKMRLLDALNTGKLSVPASMQEVEKSLKKQYTAAERKAKADQKAQEAIKGARDHVGGPSKTKASAGNHHASAAKQAAGGEKKKSTAAEKKTKTEPKTEPKAQGAKRKRGPESGHDEPNKKSNRGQSAGPRGKTSARGSGDPKTSAKSGPPSADNPKPRASTTQTARRGGGPPLQSRPAIKKQSPEPSTAPPRKKQTARTRVG